MNKKQWEKSEVIDLSICSTNYEPTGGDISDGTWVSIDGTKIYGPKES